MAAVSDVIERRCQAVMKCLRDNYVARALPNLVTGETDLVPYDDNDLHGLAMQLQFAVYQVSRDPS